jgi:hypothetical protein
MITYSVIRVPMFVERVKRYSKKEENRKGN